MTNPVPLNDWIHRQASRFEVDSPEAVNAAIDRMAATFGDAIDMLGFGEALHGGEAILMLRNRMFQRLVEAHGYSAIAMETSFPRSAAVNDYVQGRGTGDYEAIQDSGYSYGFRRLEANRELVEWMRQYNADPVHAVKLQFYGFDSPTEMVGTDSPRQVLHVVLDYLASMDSARAEQRRKHMDALIGDDAAWLNPAAMMDPTLAVGLSPAATALRIETEDLMTELKIRRPELIARSDAEHYHEACHYASVARNLLNYHAGVARQTDERIAELLGLRDAMMAENLAYIADRERKRGKVLVYAHNRHLQRSPVEWQLGPHHLVWWAAGAHLHELFGKGYAAIASGLVVSDDNGIAQPEPGTLEAQVEALPGTGVFIPIHRGQGLDAAEIAALPERTGSTKNSMYVPLNAQSLTDFDGLLILHSTTYQRGGNPLP